MAARARTRVPAALGQLLGNTTTHSAMERCRLDGGLVVNLGGRRSSRPSLPAVLESARLGVQHTTDDNTGWPTTREPSALMSGGVDIECPVSACFSETRVGRSRLLSDLPTTRGRSAVSRFWLLDQHGSDGLTALVETDGRLQIVDVLRFGPSITGLDDQQEVWDKVIGRVAPTMKPVVNAVSIDEEGIAPHPDLRRGGQADAGSVNRAGRRAARGGPGQVGQVDGGPTTRRGSRGER